MHSGAAAGAAGPAPELVVCGSRLVGAAPEGKESGKSSKSRSDKKKVSKKVIDPPFQYERNNPAIKVPAFSLLLARQKSSIRQGMHYRLLSARRFGACNTYNTAESVFRQYPF